MTRTSTSHSASTRTLDPHGTMPRGCSRGAPATLLSIVTKETEQ
ncbi:hypothetical protein QCD71_18285 [Sphingomonas sp. PsM26]|nr:hypothetical protein [Sphingomonas sp. PsM26]